MGGGKKEALDPEAEMRKKFRAKCRFRAIIRMVMENAHWMIEGVDHYEGVDDVKRRVEQAVRSKAKKKQLLNVKDKALLCQPALDRTDSEKQYIFRIIGGLKCFKRYPNHVKKKLAAATYFKYYGPGRVIVRQHHDAHALYFIVTGDVTVSQMIYDDLLQKLVSVEIGSMHTGDMFGEVSLLHNIPRTATVTTVGHCEVLALMKEDFKNILQASVQKQWDEVRRAMQAFTYFDALDEVAKREGCIVAKMKSYAENETLLGDGVGVANFVYFVLSGKCQMIETLRVSVTTRLGREYYQLYDPYVPEIESEENLDKYFDAYNKASRSKSFSKQKISSTHVESPDRRKSIRIEESGMKSESLDKTNEEKSKEEYRTSLDESVKSNLILTAKDPSRPSVRISSLPELPDVPPNLKTYFMQVCQLNPGASFGFGENMRDRRIVALTPVDCMLMPKIWLLQRNTANIWTRIQHYLERKIPTKKMLFKEFVSSRRWAEYREHLVQDVVARSNTVNDTSIHDVPYSIRMDEMLDL